MTVLDHPPVSRPRYKKTPPVSVTIDDLRPGEIFRPYGGADPDGAAHYLVVLNTGLYGDQVEHAYAHDLTGPLRALMWGAVLLVPDPHLDADGFHQRCWWTPDTPIELGLILRCERLGLAYPWRHGRAAGPLLGPSSRA